MAGDIDKCDCAFCVFLSDRALIQSNDNTYHNNNYKNQVQKACKESSGRVVSKTAIRNPIGRLETNKNTREVALPVI